MATTKKQVTYKDTWLCILSLIYGIILAFVLVDGSYDNLHFGEFFTNLTNILCCAWLLLFALTSVVKSKSYNNIIRNKVLVLTIVNAITITFLIVALWLDPIWKGEWLEKGISHNLLFTHLLSAIVMWIVFYFMKTTGKFNWKRTFICLAYPLAYFAYILIRHFIVGDTWFPYNFTDPSSSLYKGNYGIYIPVILAIALIFYGITYFLYKIKVWANPKQL
jgi:hypothetical protein